MVRLTRYMKELAARGNARVVQPTLDTAPTAPVLLPQVLRDHAHRTRSGRTLRALPGVVCSPCFAVQGEHRAVFAECADARCTDSAAGCEQCGTPQALPLRVVRDKQRQWGR